MKRIISVILVLILAFSMFTVISTAETTYNYQRHAFKDMYGGDFVFEKAAAGYGIDYYTADDKNYVNPLIIVSDESSFAFETGENGSSTYFAAGIEKKGRKNIITDYMQAEISESDNRIVSALCEECFDEYDAENAIVFLHAEGGYLVGIMTEKAAAAHEVMITYPGPVLESDKQDDVIAFGEPYYTDEGLAYDYTVQNNTGKKMDGHYALLTYHEKSYTNVYGERSYVAQIHPIDVELVKGATLYGSLVSDFGELSGAKAVWIEFNSEDEKNTFLTSEGLVKVESIYGDRYIFGGDAGEALLSETFSIIIK